MAVILAIIILGGIGAFAAYNLMMSNAAANKGVAAERYTAERTAEQIDKHSN